VDGQDLPDPPAGRTGILLEEVSEHIIPAKAEIQ
jgi:hypothetical protein